MLGEARRTMPTSLEGGIPVETVMEDDSSSEEEFPITHEDEAIMDHHTVNPAVKLAFKINREERKELFALRKKMMDFQQGLKKEFSISELETEILVEEDNFNAGFSGSTDGCENKTTAEEAGDVSVHTAEKSTSTGEHRLFILAATRPTWRLS